MINRRSMCRRRQLHIWSIKDSAKHLILHLAKSDSVRWNQLQYQINSIIRFSVVRNIAQTKWIATFSVIGRCRGSLQSEHRPSSKLLNCINVDEEWSQHAFGWAVRISISHSTSQHLIRFPRWTRKFIIFSVDGNFTEICCGLKCDKWTLNIWYLSLWVGKSQACQTPYQYDFFFLNCRTELHFMSISARRTLHEETQKTKKHTQNWRSMN